MPFLIAQTFVLLLVATAVGLVAGWLIWGGGKRGVATEGVALPEVHSAELETLRGVLDARTNDVARLRRKLKRAVEELESHANQLEAAEAHIEAFTQSMATGEPMVVRDDVLIEEHANLRDQIRFADARVTTLEHELSVAREQSAAVDNHAEERERVVLLEHELNEAQTVIRDGAERVTYLEHQALLWQNEADRLQSVIDEGAADGARGRAESEQAAQILAREHETALSSLRMEASGSRLRADAAAEHLARLQHELRAVQERSTAHVESTRAAMADLDRHLALAHATLNDAKPHTAEFAASAPDLAGLFTLPGMTTSMVEHLHELGVDSLTDVSQWSVDDVERISAWLPEHPDVITANNWVASARALLAGGTVHSASGS